MRSIEQHYGAAGGRFLCPQTVCRRSLWLTSPSPQCNYRLFVLGTRGRSWQKISIKRNRTYPNTFLHLQLCAPWFLCFTYRVNDGCLWPTGVIHRIKALFNFQSYTQLLKQRRFQPSFQTQHFPQFIYILSTSIESCFVSSFLGCFPILRRRSLLVVNKGNCLLFVTIQVAWKHICYCQTLFECLLMCVSLVLLLFLEISEK